MGLGKVWHGAAGQGLARRRFQELKIIHNRKEGKKMGVPIGAPQAVHDHWNSMPQNNFGDFYAKVRPPGMPFGFWYKVPAWGQLCDGTAHYAAVGCMLHNNFPLKGRGWIYVEWKSKPDNPHLCKHPTRGKIPKEHQKPFNPDFTYSWFNVS